MQRLILALLMMLLPLSLFAAEPVYLSKLQIKPSLTTSRFTFILTDKTHGRVKYIPHPDRIEIELENTYKKFELQKANLNGSNVTSIQSEEAMNNALRFIFKLRSEANWDVKFLPDTDGAGIRLQLSIMTTNKKTVSKVTRKAVKNSQTSQLQQAFHAKGLDTFATLNNELNHRKAKQNKNETVLQTAAAEQANKQPGPPRPVEKKQKTFTVVIDAGHGGKDSGALGGNGAQEKDIVLNIAKKLAKKMNELPNMRAILTRNGDYFVPLRKRLSLAREAKGDLFVAIHADAYFENDATGASVYALSQHGASNEAARWLAHRGNDSELGGVALDSLTDRDPMLRSVLVDLAQTATIQDSIRLGNKVLDALEDVSRLHYTHVERAPFVVLKAPDIPSILVETGFITNPKEAKRLTDPVYQDQVANALRHGIKQYLQKYALNG